MKIAIGIPIVDHVAGECFGSLAMQVAEVAKEGHDPVIASCLNVFPHDIARNRLLKDIRRYDIDMVYFLDADMVIPRGAFKTLLKAHNEADNCVLMSGQYYRRGYPYTCVWSIRDKDNIVHQASAKTGVHKIDGTGLGCALVDLRWAERNLVDPWFKMKENEEGTLIWEDMFFCNKIKQAGGEIYGCGDVRCGHIQSRGMIDDDNVDELRKEFVTKVIYPEVRKES